MKSATAEFASACGSLGPLQGQLLTRPDRTRPDRTDKAHTEAFSDPPLLPSASAMMGRKHLGVFLVMITSRAVAQTAPACNVICNGYCMRPLQASECPALGTIQSTYDKGSGCSAPGLTVGDLCEGDREQNLACGYDFSQTNNCANDYDVWIVEAPVPSPPSPPPRPPVTTVITDEPRTQGRCTIEATREQCARAAQANGGRPFVGDMRNGATTPGIGCIWVYPFHYRA